MACAISKLASSFTNNNSSGNASMSGLSRRRFLALTGAFTAVAAGGFTSTARAAMGPNDKFDLVIKGGDVIDPSQSLRGKRDIGIRWGRIEAIENEMVSIAVGLGSEIQCERESPTLASRFEHLLASAARIPGEPGGRWVAAVSDILDSAAQRQSRSLTQMIGSCADHLPLAVWPDRVIEHALIS